MEKFWTEYRVEKRKSLPQTNFWNKYIKDKHYQKSLISVYDLFHTLMNSAP